MNERIEFATIVAYCLIIGACTDRTTVGAGEGSSRGLTPHVEPARAVALDSAYGNRLVRSRSCFALSHSSGTDRPDVETYALSGELISRWAASGAGPGELRSVDGLASFADTILVWDRANARVTLLDCAAVPARSVQLGFAGNDLAVLAPNAFVLTFDPVSPDYGAWVVDGVAADTLGPRVGVRLRGSKDLIAGRAGDAIAILDVSVGALLRFRRGESTPSRVDTLPEEVQTVLRGAFRTLWTNRPDVGEAPNVPLSPLWARMLGPDTLIIGYPEYPVTAGVAAAIWPIGEAHIIPVFALSDSVQSRGLYSITGVAVWADTLANITQDSLYRYSLRK